MMDHYHDLDVSFREGMFVSATESVEDAAEDVYGKGNALLYHFDMIMSNHLAGSYEASNRHCEAADRLGEDLFTRSMAAEFGSLFTSDLDIPYRGEDSERVMVHLVSAVNYAILGKAEDALVEARKMDARIKELRSGFGAGRYEEDPFGRYLSALLFQEQGELDDAFISVRQALAAYAGNKHVWKGNPPGGLLQLASDLAARTGQQELLDGKVLPPPSAPFAQEEGEILLLHLVGPGPRKYEKVFQISLGEGMVFVNSMDIKDSDQKKSQTALSTATGLASSTQVVVAYPAFDQPKEAAFGALVSVDGCGGDVETELVEDVSLIEKTNLEDRMDRDRARMIARAVLKFLLAQTAGAVGEKASGEQWVGVLARLLTQAAMSATEAADIRSWRTLPSKIYLTRIRCPAGIHSMRLRLLGADSFDTWAQVYVPPPDEGSSAGPAKVASSGFRREGSVLQVDGVGVSPGSRTWVSLGTW